MSKERDSLRTSGHFGGRDSTKSSLRGAVFTPSLLGFLRLPACLRSKRAATGFDTRKYEDCRCCSTVEPVEKPLVTTLRGFTVCVLSKARSVWNGT